MGVGGGREREQDREKERERKMGGGGRFTIEQSFINYGGSSKNFCQVNKVLETDLNCFLVQKSDPLKTEQANL